MTPKVLIVEDIDFQAAAIQADINALPADQEAECGIDDIIFDTAKSKTSALAYLERAVLTASPYDIVLLDLSLPLNDGSSLESTEYGYEVLMSAYESGSARAIIVVSVFDTTEYVIRAMRHRAADFLGKPYGREELQKRFVTCWRGLLTRDTESILRERVADLGRHADKWLAHRFSACFSTCLAALVTQIEGMKHDLGDRFGLSLEGDPGDSFVQRVAAIESDVFKAKSDWRLLQAGLTEKEGEQREVIVETAIADALRELRPCLVVKRLSVDGPAASSTAVLSFGNDATVLLRELILGLLSDLEDWGATKTSLTIVISKNDAYAHAVLRDDSPVIAERVAGAVNTRSGPVRGEGIGRAWGLSVAQYLATLGGGSVEVGSVLGERLPNVVSYRIPLARHG